VISVSESLSHMFLSCRCRNADPDSPYMAYGCDFGFWWPMVVIVNWWCCDFVFCFWTMTVAVILVSGL
jgi:hypothetical protein